MTRYYEDIDVGDPRELGTVTVSREEIIEFAETYDPLPYHLDDDGAVAAGHEGVIASGYHTLALVNSVVTREYRQDVASIAGFGIERLEWPNPVRPDDILTVFHEVLDKRRSESRPDAGITEASISAENEDGETVITYETGGLVQRRP